LITSTSFIIGTGFIKCIPITCAGRVVTAAISVIEIEEVLVANMAFGPANADKSVKIFFLIVGFSVAASIIKSAFLTPSAKEV
jgi:hypothetical protein